MNWIDRIRWLATASVGEKGRLVLALTGLLAFPVLLSILSFSRLRLLIVRASSLFARVVPGSPSPEHIIHTVEMADYHLLGGRTCLIRSLTAETLLRLYGYSPDHRIGVKKGKEETITAHSWLEIDGRILIGDVNNLSEFDRLPPLDERLN